MKSKNYFTGFLLCMLFTSFIFGQNPFLRPGSNNPRPPVITRPVPPPPPPKPQNTNLELRGFFKFNEQWFFSIFDRATQKGVWLRKGESLKDGSVKIESFNPETEVLKMAGGTTLSLKKSDNKVLQVPSGIPVPKSSPKKQTTPTNVPRKINLQGGRSVTIPPRNPNPLPVPKK